MRDPWAVPRMWEGQPVAILASGPSMNRATVAAVMAAGMKMIAINRTVELAPHADMLYASDGLFWQRCDALGPAAKAAVDGFRGLKVSVFADGNKSRRSQMPPDDVKMLRNTGVEGFDPDPSCIRTGNNGGYQALHVAAHTGGNPIWLFGFDMHGGHWHGRYPIPLRNTKPEQYVAWIQIFPTLARALAARGIDVWNATPMSALTAFPMMDFPELAAA